MSLQSPPPQNLSFVYRPAKDEPAVTESELSRQLHSSVRTPNLETSLRLLSQGADPNYYHPEKNSTPLQVRRIYRVMWIYSDIFDTDILAYNDTLGKENMSTLNKF